MQLSCDCMVSIYISYKKSCETRREKGKRSSTRRRLGYLGSARWELTSRPPTARLQRLVLPPIAFACNRQDVAQLRSTNLAQLQPYPTCVQPCACVCPLHYITTSLHYCECRLPLDMAGIPAGNLTSHADTRSWSLTAMLAILVRHRRAKCCMQLQKPSLLMCTASTLHNSRWLPACCPVHGI